VGPDYRPKSAADLALPAAYLRAEVLPLVSAGDADWWERFEDPALPALVASALTGNTDIAAATARLQQARESLRQAQAQSAPTINNNGSAGRLFSSAAPDRDSFSESLDARWTADLFGGLARGRQASAASLDAARFSLADVQRVVVAELARNLIDARTTALRLVIAHETLRTQDDNLVIAGFRVRAGLVSGLDEEQARSQRAATAASIPALMRTEAAARNRVAVLAGMAPEAIDPLLGTGSTVPQAPALAAGTPADLLRRRPDLRAAERRLAAASARIGVAQAQLYPALVLTGSLGSSATSIRTLTDVVTGQVFASLSATIFDGGRLRSVVRQRRAEAEESLADYRGSVLGALEDVENALAGRAASDARLADLGQQVAAADAAARLARSNYRAGLTDFRTLLDAERTLLSARDSEASARGDRAKAAIQLYLALGGDWPQDSEVPGSNRP
jgi:NodT family efflux transporter outer membrane factor (OMF) lipoprotein